MPPKKLAVALLLVFAAVTLAYSNHFHNGFHFDDFHTVNNNPYIRSLHNARLFFTDPTTFSVLPANRTYRPLVTLSLAFDYWLGGGLNPPVWFHVDMFLWFLAQLGLMFVLFRLVLAGTRTPDVDATGAPRFGLHATVAALFAVALYGLHPAMAETVNYIIQRGDLYSTMLVVAALALYAANPNLRKFGIYLLPLALALVTKQPAAIFPALLFAYVVLFERPGRPLAALIAALLASLPSLAVVAVMLWLQKRMMPPTFMPGIISAHDYIVTQPWVALHYFVSFFAPVKLSADTDQTAFTTLFTREGILGLAFVIVLIAAIWVAARREEWRPASFGFAWFLLSLLPTALYPLSELENDHRMFLPFVGLALAAGCAGLRLFEAAPRVLAPTLATVAIVILAACGVGTHNRNEVWLNEATLWRDVSIKSPRNGRGLMNYGLTLMAAGDNEQAMSYFQRALQFTPNYYILEINLAIVLGELHRDAEAEAHFHRAMELAPNDEQPPFYYGRWLVMRGRLAEAIPLFQRSIIANRDYLDARYALMQAYWDAGLQPLAKSLAADTLQMSPGDGTAMRFYRGQAAVEALPNPLADVEEAARKSPTPENYLNLSLAYHQAKRYQDCIRAAREAIRLKPDYAEAYNNISAGYEALGDWDQAIAAARQALRFKPDFPLAKNNLDYSEKQKKLSGK
jgi:Flp pilus assembly protein TadD